MHNNDGYQSKTQSNLGTPQNNGGSSHRRLKLDPSNQSLNTQAHSFVFSELDEHQKNKFYEFMVTNPCHFQ